MYQAKVPNKIDTLLNFLESLASKFKELDAHFVFAVKSGEKKIILVNDLENPDFDVIDAILEAVVYDLM